MISRLRIRIAVTLVSLVTIGSIAGLTGLSSTAGASTPTRHCRSLSRHHFRTPHKDLDRDGCDRHSPDDGDGRTT